MKSDFFVHYNNFKSAFPVLLYSSASPIDCWCCFDFFFDSFQLWNYDSDKFMKSFHLGVSTLEHACSLRSTRIIFVVVVAFIYIVHRIVE